MEEVEVVRPKINRRAQIVLKYERKGEFALYRLFNAQSEVLYVGVSNNPGERVATHKRLREWWSEVDMSKTTLDWFDIPAEAATAEIDAIRTERPKYNIAGADGLHANTYPTNQSVAYRNRAFRVSDDLWNLAQRTAEMKGETVSDAVRKFLTDYINRKN